jgi:hypothetical protein
MIVKVDILHLAVTFQVPLKFSLSIQHSVVAIGHFKRMMDDIRMASAMRNLQQLS